MTEKTIVATILMKTMEIVKLLPSALKVRYWSFRILRKVNCLIYDVLVMKLCKPSRITQPIAKIIIQQKHSILNELLVLCSGEFV